MNARATRRACRVAHHIRRRAQMLQQTRADQHAAIEESRRAMQEMRRAEVSELRKARRKI